MKIPNILTGAEWSAWTKKNGAESDETEETFPTFFITPRGNEFQLTSVWSGAEHRDAIGERLFCAIRRRCPDVNGLAQDPRQGERENGNGKHRNHREMHGM